MSPRSLVRYEEVRRRGKDPAVQESDAPYADGRYFDANCQASNVVNDCVHVVAEVGGIPSVDRSDPALSITMPAIGIIVLKYTPTTCVVQHVGEITTISGLIPGLWYFVGPAGQPNLVPPPIGSTRQLFGYALGASKFLLTPNFMADSSLFGPGEKTGVSLIGIQDGVNRVFTTPEAFVHNANMSVRMYHNGRRLLQSSLPSAELGEYYVSEGSGPSTGYNTIHFMAFAPDAYSMLRADYRVA